MDSTTTHPVHAFILDCVMQGDPHAIHTLLYEKRYSLLFLLTIHQRYSYDIRSLSFSPRSWRNRNRTVDHWLRSLVKSVYISIYLQVVCRVTFDNDLSKRILIARWGTACIRFFLKRSRRTINFDWSRYSISFFFFSRCGWLSFLRI